MGHILCEQGMDRSAIKYNDIALAVRKELLDPLDSEIANALSNAALSMVGCRQDMDTALVMLLESLRIDLANPPEDYQKVLHLRHFNLGFAYKALGDMDKARYHID
jgi:tetratricopeptide (TPR) repeat protein